MARSVVSTSQMNAGGRLGPRGSSFKAQTSGVTVAVNSSVCLFPGGGSTPRQVSRSSNILPFPPANNRSASSNTTNLHLLNP